MPFLRLFSLPVMLSLLTAVKDLIKPTKAQRKMAAQFPSISAFLTGRELSCFWTIVPIYTHHTRVTGIFCFVCGFSFWKILHNRSVVPSQGVIPHFYSKAHLECWQIFLIVTLWERSKVPGGLRGQGCCSKHPTTPQRIVQPKMSVLPRLISTVLD